MNTSRIAIKKVCELLWISRVLGLLQGRVRKEVILKETSGEPVGQLPSPLRIGAQQGADGEEGNQHQLPSTGWSVSIGNVKRKETKCISWPCSLWLWRRISSLNLPGYSVQGMTTHLGIYSIANKGYYVMSLIMSVSKQFSRCMGGCLKNCGDDLISHLMFAFTVDPWGLCDPRRHCGSWARCSYFMLWHSGLCS